MPKTTRKPNITAAILNVENQYALSVRNAIDILLKKRTGRLALAKAITQYANDLFELMSKLRPGEQQAALNSPTIRRRAKPARDPLAKIKVTPSIHPDDMNTFPDSRMGS